MMNHKGFLQGQFLQLGGKFAVGIKMYLLLGLRQVVGVSAELKCGAATHRNGVFKQGLQGDNHLFPT